MNGHTGDADDETPILFVVDDDEGTLDVISEVAADAGWGARGFRRLRDLRPWLRRRQPTLLILDDDLPDGSGGDLARELHSNPDTSDLPLVVCTAAHGRRLAEIQGWAPVLAKPFRLEEIERFLAAAWRRRRHDTRRQAAR